MMTRTFKVLSALLSYPTNEIVAAAPAMAEVLQKEGLVPRWRFVSMSW
jgi:nitrate reductase delta subunit